MKKLLILFSLLFFLPAFSQAQILQGTNFEVRDPVFHVGGGEDQLTSTNYRLIGSVSQIAIGTSSATNFQGAGGFLYFPEVTLPAVTATPGASQVSLSWTASVGSLGWIVSGYNVGQATVSGGPYAYTFVGAVLSATAVGLANGTTYYFVVRPQDFFGNSLATSTEVSATPVAAAPPPPPPPPGGGGGPPGLITAPPVVITPPPAIIPGVCPYPKQDLNCDGKIDIQDLSIFLYFTPQSSPNPADFNEDDNVDIRDLSSLFFTWTERLIAFGPDEQIIVYNGNEEAEMRRPGFLERFFGTGGDRPAAVVSSDTEEKLSGPGGLLNSIADFLWWVLVKVVEFILKIIEWFTAIFGEGF